MTFSYQTDLSRNIDLVRFHTGDTNAAGAWLPDETITALIAQKGSWQGAVIAEFRYILTQLSQPNFKADWLQIDNVTARAGYQKMMDEKKSELGYGLGQTTSGSTNVYRSDSRQTSEPDYADYGANRNELATGGSGGFDDVGG